MQETQEMQDARPTHDELEEMRERVKEMELEAEKLREMQAQVDKELNIDSKNETDGRSVYVGNVDYAVTPEDIQAHFSSCGTINRVTILCDKYSGQPKGFAYIEFADSALVANAVLLDESTLKGRQLKVTAKRTNVPTFLLRGRGRGRGRAGFRGRGFRGRGFRGGRGGYAPY